LGHPVSGDLAMNKDALKQEMLQLNTLFLNLHSFPMVFLKFRASILLHIVSPNRSKRVTFAINRDGLISFMFQEKQKRKTIKYRQTPVPFVNTIAAQAGWYLPTI